MDQKWLWTFLKQWEVKVKRIQKTRAGKTFMAAVVNGQYHKMEVWSKCEDSRRRCVVLCYIHKMNKEDTPFQQRGISFWHPWAQKCERGSLRKAGSLGWRQASFLLLLWIGTWTSQNFPLHTLFQFLQQKKWKPAFINCWHIYCHVLYIFLNHINSLSTKFLNFCMHGSCNLFLGGLCARAHVLFGNGIHLSFSWTTEAAWHVQEILRGCSHEDDCSGTQTKAVMRSSCGILEKE